MRNLLALGVKNRRKKFQKQRNFRGNCCLRKWKKWLAIQLKGYWVWNDIVQKNLDSNLTLPRQFLSLNFFIPRHLLSTMHKRIDTEYQLFLNYTISFLLASWIPMYLCPKDTFKEEDVLMHIFSANWPETIMIMCAVETFSRNFS